MTSKASTDSARRQTQRLDRIRRRLRQLYLNGTNIQEVSALEWAIPILEAHIVDQFGSLPVSRYPMYKHERRDCVEKLLERDGDLCYLCDQPLDGERSIDHVVPLVKGGKDNMSNYRLAHHRCNALKGHDTVEVFRKKLQSLKMEPEIKEDK